LVPAEGHTNINVFGFEPCETDERSQVESLEAAKKQILQGKSKGDKAFYVLEDGARYQYLLLSYGRVLTPEVDLAFHKPSTALNLASVVLPALLALGFCLFVLQNFSWLVRAVGVVVIISMSMISFVRQEKEEQKMTDELETAMKEIVVELDQRIQAKGLKRVPK
jgi:hypothetical protein